MQSFLTHFVVPRYSNSQIKNFDWQDLLKIKDPFGDFDFIFSAAYGNKIVEYPIHYRARVYGSTHHGLKMVSGCFYILLIRL